MLQKQRISTSFMAVQVSNQLLAHFILITVSSVVL